VDITFAPRYTAIIRYKKFVPILLAKECSMPGVSLTLIAALLGVAAIAAQGQEAPAVVQPGAPGHASKAVSPNEPPAQLREPTEADVKFMQGMIMHHGQAVEMTKLVAAKSHNPEVLELAKKIDISQTDEMGFMKRWLQDRGKPISEMEDMPGMDVSSMMPAMPGMLTKAQMDALRKANGAEFDHLFLTGMIQHHSGALVMVKELFATAGAAQDPLLFDFTSDVDNTQQAEMDIMRNMLAKEKQK
jgi:uncharacterized protein (DUF305 family)